jgi:hypothetical protein
MMVRARPVFWLKKGDKQMKKLMALILTLVSTGFVISAEAKAPERSHQNSTVAANSEPQWERDRYGRDQYDRRYDRYNRRRTVTRVVRYGRRVYRETYLVRSWPNGRTNTVLISRTRIA